MIDIIMSADRVNALGRLGENEHRRALFDIAEYRAMYPGATFALLNLLPGTTAAYPVARVQAGAEKLAWTITATDLAAVGRGMCELVVYQGDVIAKSVIFLTEVLPALDGSGDPPEPWEDWREYFVELKADAEAAAQDAEAASQAVQDMDAEAQTLAPGASAAVTKTVDPDTGAVTLTFYLPRGDTGATGPQGEPGERGEPGAQGQPGKDGKDGKDGATGPAGADGADGFSPTVTIAAIAGGHRVTITDATGAHAFDVMDGEGAVQDVKVNGSSVLVDGTANIPAATTSGYGVVQIGYGLRTVDNRLSVNPAGASDIKGGTSTMLPLTPQRQQEAVYFGLSKAAGVDLANETVTVGTYPDTAKGAIRTMLGAVGDVQVNGVSVVSGGVANVPVASASTPGVAKVSGAMGIDITNGFLTMSSAEPQYIQQGSHLRKAITPKYQHEATFYGLAKAAGADMASVSGATVGVYPEAQKAAIRAMLGIGDASPNNYAFDGRDLSTVFADADALFDAYSQEDYSRIRVGDYWPVTLNGTYRDYGRQTAPAGIPYYSDEGLTTEVGTLDAATEATGVLNNNLPGSHEAYCTIKIGSATYYVAWSDCLDYQERTLSNAVMLFEVAGINPYWRYGDRGELGANSPKPHLLLSPRDGLPHTLKMRKLTEVWEGQHIERFTGDGTTREFTLSGTVGTLGFVFVAGAKKTYSSHYTLSGSKITFVQAQTPAAGAEIVVEYMDGKTPWTGSALYRTFNDPDYGIIKLIQTADAKLYAHIHKGPNGKGMRYAGETRSKTNQQSYAWEDRGVLFLPTEDEVWGRPIYSASGMAGYAQQLQWPIYAMGGRRHFAKGAGNAASRTGVWTASSYGVTYFALVSNNGIPTNSYAAYAYVAAPAFLLS